MEKIHCNLNEMEGMIRRVLAEGGSFEFYPRGTSMLPFIREGRDKVLLKALPSQLKKYQIVLYKRENGAFVLHRIIRVKRDTYTMRGDHQFVSEAGIHREQMIGIVSTVITPEKRIDTDTFFYVLKSAIWTETAFFRRCFYGIYRRIRF